MPLLSRPIIKSFFQTGDKPTQSQFAAFIDSALIYADDRDKLGLHNYDSTQVYVAGDTSIYNHVIYQANTTTTPGPFNPLQWNEIAGTPPGSVTFKGVWNASANTPNLNTIGPSGGDYYIVSVSGSTPLNSPPNVINSWNAGDWAIFDGTLWGKIALADSVTDGVNLGTGAEVFNAKNTTILEFNSLVSNDGSVNVIQGTNEIDFGVEFDDTGTSASRAWSAFKIDSELAGKEPLLGFTPEDIANKVIAISGASTDSEYPSAKLVYDQLALKQDDLGFTPEDVANKVVSISGSSTDTEYPSARLLYDQLALKQNNLGYTAEDTANKVTSLSVASTNVQYPGAKLVFDQLARKEDLANKVISLSVSSTNVQYPGAKLVFDQLALKEDLSNKVTAFQPTPDNTHYPSEKLVADTFAAIVFGRNYAAVESTVASTTSLTTFQNCLKSAGVPLTLSTGALPAGTYRLSWSCVVSNNSRQGEFRLVDNTVPAAPVVIGRTLLFQSTIDTEKIPLMVTENIVLASAVANKDYILQFRCFSSTGGNTQTMQIGSKIEFWRVL